MEARHERVSDERLEAMRHDLWLDRPLVEQYVRFITGALHGDLGISLYNHRPVMETIRRLDRYAGALICAGLTVARRVSVAL